jgi:4-hydroxyphenylpyruvate dioxygenase
MNTAQPSNPVGLRGIDFIEFASPAPDRLHQLFTDFGFTRTMQHAERRVDLYQQGQIAFLLNREERSFASAFSAAHGPSICSMGWRVDNAADGQAAAIARGAHRRDGDYQRGRRGLPAVSGIGESLIYLTDGPTGLEGWRALGFVPLENVTRVPDCGFTRIDHLTNNVVKGTMGHWSDFYRQVFGFTQVRYFDIRGAKTGLTSYALRSPDGSFCIPINEADEKKSQINEYLDEYKGPGIQHLAFLTDNILGSLEKLDGRSIQFLDIEPEYYQEVFERVPKVKEDRTALRKRNVLIDGDDQGYLLQIFTKNVVGPIFIEIIQRENHLSFGEGNFGALFRSIERDQMKRGVL